MGLRVRDGSDFHRQHKTKVSWRADATADNFFKSAKLSSTGCERDDSNLEMCDPPFELERNAGWKIKPFSSAVAILNHEGIHSQDATIISEFSRGRREVPFGRPVC
jgi:hypothetical protein